MQAHNVRVIAAGETLGPPQPLERDEDPIAEILRELRDERAARLEAASELLEQAE
jgi:hypothetical protein